MGSDRSRDQSAVDGVTGNATDVFAADAEVTQFAVRHAAEFGDGLTILAPVVERASDVHGVYLFGGLDPSVGPFEFVDLNICCNAKSLKT